MKAFVAGATGVLGWRAVTRLVAAGVEVTGVARTAERATRLEELGATPAAVSLFDPGAVAAAVTGHDVVVNLATAIPTGPESADRAAWATNHRIRREGARSLVDAALDAGAGLVVQESITLLYADGGDAALDESAPLAPTWVTASAQEAEQHAARFAAASPGGRGVALRFGQFYGPDSAHTVDTVEAARAGMAAVLGPPEAYLPSITTDDAADAVAAVVTGGTGAPGAGPALASGTYNVVDDRSMPRAEYVAALAEALGTGPLTVPPQPELPPEFAMMTRSHRVVSTRFAEISGWRPRHPSAHEGWRAIVAAMDAADGSPGGLPIDPADPGAG